MRQSDYYPASLLKKRNRVFKRFKTRKKGKTYKPTFRDEFCEGTSGRDTRIRKLRELRKHIQGRYYDPSEK